MPEPEDARSWYEPSSGRWDALRYAICAVIVSGAAATGAELLARQSTGAVAIEAQDAVEVDLAPALASAMPKSDAPDGPEQQASAAAPIPPAPPPKPEADKPPDPPPPEAPDPAAVIAKNEEAPPPPPPAPPAPVQEERAPAGAAVPKAADVETEPTVAPPRAQVIAAWQRAMVERLERAKRAVHRRAGLRGTVEIAFRIDREGAIVSRSVQRSSGNPALDEAALTLLAAAAPFPAPPAGLGDTGLSFVVPVHVDLRH